MAENVDNEGTHVITLTSKEVFALQCALEQFCDIDDRAYASIIEIAGDVTRKLPQVSTKWDDIDDSDN